MKAKTALAALTLAASLLAVSAPAATNRWDAASGLRPDQMLYRWPLYRSGSPPLPVLSGGVLTFFSTNAFSDNEFYTQSGDMLAMPSRTVMEAQMRYVSGSTSRGDRSAACMSVSTADGVGNGVWIGPDEIWTMTSLNVKGATATVDTDSAFHTYRIEVEGLAAGSVIQVYYDGALTLTGSMIADVNVAGDRPRILWGDATSHANGVSEWRYVWHNAAAVPAVWGVKSYGPPAASGVPATLLNFAEDGSAFTAVGPVTLGSSQIDVDGLALSPEGTLFGFQVGIPGSRLISIDKGTAVATAVGPVLANRDIRGAVFTLAGQIVALDAAQKQILRFDPATGQVIGTGVPLQVTTQPGVVQDVCDIAQAPDGTFLVAWNYNELHSVDLNTGASRLLFRDSVPDRQGDVVTLAGLAFSRDATNPATLFAYDIFLQDDIYTYQTDAGFSRAVPFMNLISGYNAGRGDLATVPPLLCEITDFQGSTQSQTLQAAFPAGRHAWVEWKADLNAPNWTPLTNTLVIPDPTSGTWFANATWTISPSLGSQAFFRVASALTPPP
jgi:hypothetical protein